MPEWSERPAKPPVPLAEKGNHVQAYSLGRAWIGGGALHDRERDSGVADAIDGLVQFRNVAHAAGQENRTFGRNHHVQQGQVAHLTGANLPHRHADTHQHLDSFARKWRAEKYQAVVTGMIREALPLGLGKLQTSPVVVTCRVLRAEHDAERLCRSAFRRRDVRLELHRVGTRTGNLVDEGVGVAKTPVVGEPHLADDETMARLQTWRTWQHQTSDERQTRPRGSGVYIHFFTTVPHGVVARELRPEGLPPPSAAEPPAPHHRAEKKR